MSARRTAPEEVRGGSAVGDAMVIAWRNLMQFVRVPPLLVFSIIQPIMFVLLFVYVFGGGLKQSVGGSYVNYLMPGILVQTTVFGATQTGVGLAEDLNKGFIDRFRSLPMARSAVLAGRTTSDMIRNALVIFLMTAVGYMVGFRIQGNAFEILLALVLALSFGHAFSWISALIGLAIKDVESVQAASFVWIFPLTFMSSAFVKVDTMPGWLQGWAKINPVTLTVDAMRGLVGGFTDWSKVAQAVAWIIVLLAFSVPLAIRQYRRLT